MDVILCMCAQSSLALWDSMDCSPPGSFVQGIFQARIVEWVAIFYSKESSQLRDWTCISCGTCIDTWILYHYHYLGSPHPCMTIGKTISLTIWTFVGKVISLLLNMLSRFVLIFLPRSCLVGYYKAILHVCNWNSRRRREIFEEMMLKLFQIWLKKNYPTDPSSSKNDKQEENLI